MNDQTNELLRAFYARRRAFEDCFASVEFHTLVATDGHATCPCCGYPTLGERARYYICEICNWEDDGQDDPEFAREDYNCGSDQVAGGPNSDYSLTEARLNFQEYRQVYRPSDTRAFERTNENRALRDDLVAIYDALLPHVSAARYSECLPSINASSKLISDDLSRRLRN